MFLICSKMAGGGVGLKMLLGNIQMLLGNIPPFFQVCSRASRDMLAGPDLLTGKPAR